MEASTDQGDHFIWIISHNKLSEIGIDSFVYALSSCYIFQTIQCNLVSYELLVIKTNHREVKHYH